MNILYSQVWLNVVIFQNTVQVFREARGVVFVCAVEAVHRAIQKLTYVISSKLDVTPTWNICL